MAMGQPFGFSTNGKNERLCPVVLLLLERSCAGQQRLHRLRGVQDAAERSGEGRLKNPAALCGAG